MRSSMLLRLLTAVLMAVAGSALVAQPASAALGVPRVYLRVLVVTDGSVWVEAIRQQLASEGVPVTVIDLNSPTRPTITTDFLSSTPLLGTPKGFFQGVVLPGNFLPALSAAEQTALAKYETTFSIRQIESYVFPNGDVGMNTPTYSGSLDGATVTATSAARSGAFRYLAGTFPFDGTAGGTESYGYLAQPLPNGANTSYTPYLTATTPSGATGVLAGVYTNAGRERLEISFAYHYFQGQFRHMAHGLVTWVTRGVHLGLWRNYFAVHVDDVFNEDEGWSSTGDCTPPASTCPPGTPVPPSIRMTAGDVAYAVGWQQANGLTMDMLYNGGAEAQFQQDGEDPTLTAFQAQANQFRWVNHTFTHQFLGCVQDFSVAPWRCQTNASGNTVWTSAATINSEINDNVAWATANGLPIDRRELVAGEHSGTQILPQQPVDNPNFVSALGSAQIRYVGLDASRELVPRPVGSALGVPRHPINIFYNASTKEQEVDEYNWIYTSAANGGSGLCEGSATTTCIAPLDPATGWDSYILPLQVKIAMSYVVRNDPRVFYLHQSNLADDRLAYPFMQGVLAAYRSAYAANTPVVTPSLTACGDTLSAQQAWATTLAANSVTAYVQANTVVLSGPSGTRVPVTVPSGTVIGTALFGAAYGGESSASVSLNPLLNPLAMLATPYGALVLPGLLPPSLAVAPNLVDVPHLALDPGLAMLFGPLDRQP